MATGGALSGCSDLSGTGDLEYVPGEGNIVQVPPGDRADPVEISGETIDGGSLDLADFRGEVVVVNVWWSNCGPCREEMPMLVEIADESDPDATEFVGINIRDNSVESAAAFERDLDVAYPSIYDPGSETLLRFGDLAPSSMPSTVLLDRDGRVAALISGAIPSATTLTELVDELMEESGDG